jgi:hypothetical protein
MTGLAGVNLHAARDIVVLVWMVPEAESISFWRDEAMRRLGFPKRKAITF